MGRGGVLDAVYGSQDGVQGSVNADGYASPWYVIINGGGHPDHREAVFVKGQGPGQGTVAADDHQPLDAVLVEIAQGFSLAPDGLEFGGAGRAQEGASLADDPTHRAGIQWDHFAVHQPGVAPLNAHDLQPVS